MDSFLWWCWFGLRWFWVSGWLITVVLFLLVWAACTSLLRWVLTEEEPELESEQDEEAAAAVAEAIRIVNEQRTR